MKARDLAPLQMSATVSLIALDTITVLPSRCAVMSECCIWLFHAFHERRKRSLRHVFQSSSVSRRTASLSGFLLLSRTFDGPLRYGASARFDRIPSSFIKTRVPEHGLAIVAE